MALAAGGTGGSGATGSTGVTGLPGATGGTGDLQGNRPCPLSSDVRCRLMTVSLQHRVMVSQSW